MILPEHIRYCLDTLEQAGFEAWAVGGCVRDHCLGLPPKDYDLCTSALPEQTKALFSDHPLILAGEKHGTVAVILDREPVEITTYRTDGDYRDNRHPDRVSFVPELREDLARRDFTVNAMAYSPARGFTDPFGGRADLEAGILRAVGDPVRRFTEDALRILRGIRFSVTYRLSPEPETEKAMLSCAPLLDRLARERVFAELCGILPKVTAEDLLRYGPILARAIPELEPMLGFDQHSPHHAYDLYTHVAHVTAAVGDDLGLRWAALLHDIGKVPTFTLDENGRGHFYGHADVGSEMADQVLRRLHAPTALREEATALISRHMTRLTPEPAMLRRQAGKLGLPTLRRLLELQEADMGSKGTGEDSGDTQFAQIRRFLDAQEAEAACLHIRDLAVNGHDLMALGYQGRQIGACLEDLLEQVLEERLPNEQDALLAWAEKGRCRQ